MPSTSEKRLYGKGSVGIKRMVFLLSEGVHQSRFDPAYVPENASVQSME